MTSSLSAAESSYLPCGRTIDFVVRLGRKLFMLSLIKTIKVVFSLLPNKRPLQALRDIDHIVTHMLELVDDVDIIYARLVVLLVIL